MKSPARLDNLSLLPNLVLWLVLASLVALLAGSASALFLWLLDVVSAYRTAHPMIIWALPFAGFVVGWVYLHVGTSVEAGNNLLIDEIHDPKKTIPLRMAPLVLFGTVISHLFGASVGREGTAVQMGGSLADFCHTIFKMPATLRRIFIMAGISAGFASVFGTPLAGAIFALEVLAIGRMRYDALLPCFVAAILADKVTLIWGIHHTHYVVNEVAPLSVWSFCATLIAGLFFGLIALTFAKSTHNLSAWMKKTVSYAPLRPLIGGLIVAILFAIFGSQRYAGLGIDVMVEAFNQPLSWVDSVAKMGMTILSLGTGFKGGEVTPLFFIGATSGNALAPLLQLPAPMLAGLGFVAVFAGAANTPIASTVMAIELFGPSMGIFSGLACVMSYLFSGNTGIYKAQRTEVTKHGLLPDWVRDKFKPKQ